MIMMIYFVIGNFRDTFSSVNMLEGYMLIVEMLKGCMLISRNAEGVHGKRKVGNSCTSGCSDPPHHTPEYKLSLS